MKLIAFSGPRGVGKTTITKIISNLLDSNNIYKISFADFLRKWILEQYGKDFCEKSLDRDYKDNNVESITIKTLNETLYIPTNNSYRDILIHTGTYLRNLNEDIFCLALEEKIKNIEKENKDSIVLIDDLRFENERKWFKALPYSTKLVVLDRDDVSIETDKYNDFIPIEKADYYYFYNNVKNPYENEWNLLSIKSMIEDITDSNIK